MFPDEPTSESYVHNVLVDEKYGVVWIGVRGTYALQEWGYEHPSMGFFGAVAKIVRDKYVVTCRPVTLSQIAAEMGNYRTFASPNSIKMAAFLNKALKQVSREAFVPRGPDEDSDEEPGSEDLDRVLREFEDSLNSKL